MGKVKAIFPADDFEHVLKQAGQELEFGIIIGWDKEDGEFSAFAGGTDNGRRPVAKDWLWLVEEFKHKLISGDYYEG
ncbi:MAG: hypothetical protein ACN2B6_11855 [Rickettsiales bacterium]